MNNNTRTKNQTSQNTTQILTSSISDFDVQNLKSKECLIGVLTGEGVGSEVVPAALSLLEVLEDHSAREFKLVYGGLIGAQSKKVCGKSLSDEVKEFTSNIFDRQGVLFCGPGGDRFVYEMREAFGLYCKFTPLQPLSTLRGAGVIREKALEGTDIIAVRENSGGIYQGSWKIDEDSDGLKTASQEFIYSDVMIRKILRVAFSLAEKRRQRLHIILKPGGIPSVSELWQQVADELSNQYKVECFEQEIDNAVYQLIAKPQQFDVLVSPNMFGDVLADCGSLLLGSRGLSYSGNFGAGRRAVYQTGHGAARDIAGSNRANPIGQIFSLGMMLRESFGWPEADAAIRLAVENVISSGYTTEDILLTECETLGTREFSAKVKESLHAVLRTEAQ